MIAKSGDPVKGIAAFHMMCAPVYLSTVIFLVAWKSPEISRYK